MFELDYSENYLLPYFFAFMAVIVISVALLAIKGGKKN
ncbi:MAG: hypothetical protein RJB62_1848 [Pseudomonadota bacterium]|jgi:hypothetical protein